MIHAVFERVSPSGRGGRLRGIFPRFVGIALEQLEDRVNPSALSPFTGSHGLDLSELVIVAPDLVGKVPAAELAGATVLNLGQGDDAIRQISAQLSTMRNVGVIRLISHGADGALMLGNQVLDQQVLHSRSREIAHWGDSLAPDADLLLYGCSVASTADGRAFVGDLAALIGAHAAASTNPTGAGGDIILEYATGQVVHGLSASLADWQLSGLQLPDSPVTSITSAALTTFTVFSSGSFPVTTSGGSPAANNFFITNGVFPAGVTIAASTGVISGIPASGTAGSYSFTINASNGVGAAATQNFTLTVALATQTITWGVPADIVYGTPLGNTQLNATVVGVVGGTAAGGLNYEPAAGELLEAGTSKLTVTAAATLNYEKAVKTVDLVVAKASQTITWADPSAITYGSLLGATQLSATVAGLAGGSAPGALIYAQPTGTLLNAGNQALTVTAAATSNYLEATKSVALVVNKAAQFIIWVNPANITYGALLTVTQLNATATGSSASGATAPGGLIFSPSLGTSLDAGSQTLSVIAVATSNYLEASKSVMLVVDKATQTITWNDPASIVYGTLLNGPQLNATVKGVTGGSAAGALSYDSGAGTLLNAGSQVLTVTAAATKNYNQAVKSVTIKVDKAPQSIAWDTPANITYGTLLSATQFNATASGSSTFGATAPGVLVYEPPLGYMLNAGTQALNVTAAATGNYLEAFKSVAIIVEKAHQTITWANPGNIVYGTLLSTTQLNATVKGVAGGSAPGVLVYEPHTGDLLNAGEQTLTVAAGATNNYLVATLTVTLIVDKAPQTITWATPANIVYGTLLDGTQLNATVVGVSVVGASEPGALIYEPHATDLLDAGTRDLTVTASATKNYLEAFKVVKLIVEKASQTISWNNPGNITYGTVLNAAQLNATATGPVGGSVVGGLSYGPTLGALLNAGNQTLTVTAAATSNYLATSKSVTLVVDKAKQTIVWETPAPITYGTPLSATQLNATSAGSTTPGASAPGALIYEPRSPGPILRVSLTVRR
ncbi:MAG: DUF4347 domain-containing protein [Planctomycetota bacterium]|nr:DUF4347 domain-containing protein [Planctomycetota bacterium]